jgi:Tfp pilus assembly protein PilF
MGKRLLPAILLLTALAAPAYADARSDAKAHVEFGIAVAQRGLWKEALYRWEKATQLDPTYAAAFNNLAVGYEHEGMLDKAAEAYERALKLEPNNALVRQNFELFKEIHDRSNQSQTP